VSQTPNKNRAAKYDYCSPVKSLRKAAPPTKPAPPPPPSEPARKPKKKLKLFPAAAAGGSGGKTHKSFSDVEERIGSTGGGFEADIFATASASAWRAAAGAGGGGAQGNHEGVFELPLTPVRNGGCGGIVSSSRRRSGETDSQPPTAAIQTRKGWGGGRSTPSSQAATTFSLGDFLVKSDTRQRGTTPRTGGIRSPAKVCGGEFFLGFWFKKSSSQYGMKNCAESFLCWLWNPQEFSNFKLY
jgi:hypothetical protein